LASIADSTGNTMNFVYTSGVITELDRAATVTDYYSYDSAGRLTGDGNDYQRVFGDSSTNYLTDNQGSVIGLVDGQGQKVAGYSYDPYGATRTITGTATGDLTKPTRIPTATPAATATTTAASTSSATATTTPSRAASPNRTPPARRATCSPTPVATQSTSRTSRANRF